MRSRLAAGVDSLATASRRWATWIGENRARQVALSVAVVLGGWPLAAALLPDGAPVGVVLQGAVFGSVTALLALGLILVYRTNRIVNFAYGGMGGVGGVLAVNLFLASGWNYFATAAAGIATGVAVGGLVERLAIRRFTNSSRLVLTVATIGLAQVLGGIELYIPRWLGGSGFVGGFRTPFTFGFDVGPVRITGDHLLVVAVVPVVIAGLSWFLRRTDAGAAVRGAAENRDRALLLGIPVARLVTIVWMVAGGLAALTAVLRAPFAGSVSSALSGPTLLLPALAAAVVARMQSLPVAFGAGIGLGVLDQIVFWNTRKASTMDVAFLVVVLVGLLLQRKTMSRAEETDASSWSLNDAARAIPRELRRLPEVRWARAGLLVVLALAAVLAPLAASPRSVNLMTVALIWGMAALSLVVLAGWGGAVSLGQFALVGSGAVVAGNVMARFNVDLFVTLVVAGAVGGAMALLLGLPALRIRGMFLAVSTLAFAVALDSYFLNPINVPGLIQENVDRPILWQRFDLEEGLVAYYLCLAFLVLTMVVVHNVRRSRSGRVLVATRDNAKAAAAAAVPTVATRLAGFVLSGVIAGVAGGLYVMVLHGTRMGTFAPSLSLEVFSMAVIGGLGSVTGALVGVFGLRWLAQVLTGELRLLVTGAGLLVVLMVMPGGVSQPLFRLRNRLLALVARRRGIEVPSLVADRRGGPSGPDEETVLAGALGGARGRSPAPRPRDTAEGDGRRSPVAPPLLSCRGVDVSYGPVQVLFGVDLDIARGELVALLGTNGAGKSTLLKAVSGLVTPTSGTIEMTGEDLLALPAHEVAARGVVQMPGGKGVFPTLTVAENLRLAQWLLRHDPPAAAAAQDRVLELLPVLRGRMDTMAGNLSGGEQQMLALAQSLMHEPQILLIDELSLGLAPTIVGDLIDVVRRVHRAGVTVVVVEQSVNVALDLAERAVFMEKGEVRFEGPSSELLGRPDLLRSVFISGAAAIGETGPAARRPGRRATTDASTRTPPASSAPTVLACEAVSRRFGGIVAVDEVDLSLREGEILGLVGQNGAGKTTLFDCVSGFLPLDGGRVLLRGRDVSGWTPRARAAAGLGRSFQEARLYPALTTAETIAVSLERHLLNRDLMAAALGLPAAALSEMAAAARVEELIELTGLGAYREKLVGELSTGTRRVAELTCMLAQDPAVVLLDEPSAGTAQREAEALGPLLLRVQEYTGCSLLVIEHDMPLLASICDRMVALELGAVIAEGTPRDVLGHPRVIASYLGTHETAVARSGSRNGGRRSRRPARVR